MQLRIDGHSAYAYTGGRAFDPALPTVVFVHGAQHDHSVWILQSRYLAHHGFGVLAVDLPGHGRSAGTPLPTVDAMADWVLRVGQAAGAERLAIVGHSMGSLIALDAAGQAPDRVSAIALCGCAYPMKVAEVLLKAARDNEPAAFDMINQWSFSGLNHRPGNPGPGFSVFNESRRLMERQKPGVLLNDFSACDAYASGESRAAQARCPVLFLLGDADLMTPPKAARLLQQALPGHRTVRLAGCGHNLMAEQPQGVLQALLDLLRPLQGQTTS